MSCSLPEVSRGSPCPLPHIQDTEQRPSYSWENSKKRLQLHPPKPTHVHESHNRSQTLSCKSTAPKRQHPVVSTTTFTVCSCLIAKEYIS